MFAKVPHAICTIDSLPAEQSWILGSFEKKYFFFLLMIPFILIPLLAGAYFIGCWGSMARTMVTLVRYFKASARSPLYTL